MNVSDSLAEGMSRYDVETDLMHEHIKAIDRHPFTFIAMLMDEMFEGTEPNSKLIVQKVTIPYIRRKGALGIVATHDLELTSLPGIANIHFSEKITDGKPVRDYRVSDGPSRREDVNAIDVLARKGFPEEIVAAARKLEREKLGTGTEPAENQAATKDLTGDILKELRREWGPCFRDISDPEELIGNMKDVIFTLLFSSLFEKNKKLVLAFSHGLTGYNEQHSKLLSHIENWKSRLIRHNPKLSRIMSNLVLLDFCSKADLSHKLDQKKINPNDGEGSMVFTFAPRTEETDLTGMGEGVRNVYIKELGDFSISNYYPLIEIVTIALVKEHMGYTTAQLAAIFADLGVNLEDLNIGAIDETSPTTLIFTLIPKIRRFEADQRVERYTRLMRFLKSA